MDEWVWAENWEQRWKQEWRGEWPKSTKWPCSVPYEVREWSKDVFSSLLENAVPLETPSIAALAKSGGSFFAGLGISIGSSAPVLAGVQSSIASGKFLDAIEMCDRLIDLQRDLSTRTSVDTLFLRGCALYAMARSFVKGYQKPQRISNFLESADCFRDIVNAMSPGMLRGDIFEKEMWTFASVNQGAAEWQGGQRTQAIKVLRAAVRTSPGCVQARALLTLALMVSGTVKLVDASVQGEEPGSCHWQGSKVISKRRLKDEVVSVGRDALEVHCVSRASSAEEADRGSASRSLSQSIDELFGTDFSQEDEDPINGGSFSFAIGDLARKASRSIGSIFSDSDDDEEDDDGPQRLGSDSIQMSRLHRECNSILEDAAWGDRDEIGRFARETEEPSRKPSADSDEIAIGHRYRRDSEIDDFEYRRSMNEIERRPSAGHMDL